MIEAGSRDEFMPDAYVMDMVRTALRQRKGPVMIRITPVTLPVVSNSKIEA